MERLHIVEEEEVCESCRWRDEQFALLNQAGSGPLASLTCLIRSQNRKPSLLAIHSIGQCRGGDRRKRSPGQGGAQLRGAAAAGRRREGAGTSSSSLPSAAHWGTFGKRRLEDSHLLGLRIQDFNARLAAQHKVHPHPLPGQEGRRDGERRGNERSRRWTRHRRPDSFSPSDRLDSSLRFSMGLIDEGPGHGPLQPGQAAPVQVRGQVMWARHGEARRNAERTWTGKWS